MVRFLSWVFGDGIFEHFEIGDQLLLIEFFFCECHSGHFNDDTGKTNAFFILTVDWYLG